MSCTSKVENDVTQLVVAGDRVALSLLKRGLHCHLSLITFKIGSRGGFAIQSVKQAAKTPKLAVFKVCELMFM